MEQALSKMYHACTICTMKIPIAILKNIKSNESYINLNTTLPYKMAIIQSQRKSRAVLAFNFHRRLKPALLLALYEITILVSYNLKQ
jgi:hypothetical protein